MRNTLFALFLFCCKVALAAPTTEILAYGSDHGAWPADNLCFPANSHLTPYQGGWILPQTCVGEDDTTTQMWFVRAGQAQKLGASATGRLLTDAATDGTTIVFAEYNELGTQTITQTNLLTSTTTKLPADWSEHFLSAFNVISPNELQFRMTYGDRQSAAGALKNGQFTQFDASGISFFFGAAISNDIRVEVLRLGQLEERAPDEIVVGIAPQFSPVVVAQDHDGNAASTVTGFYNSVGVSGHHWAALAQTAQGQILLRGTDTTVETIPLFTQFKSIDYFAPAVLSDGQVALRGTDLQGVIGLWIIDLQNQKHLLLQKGSLLTNPRGQFALGTTPFVTGPASSGTDVVIGVDLENPATHEVMEQDIVRVVP